MAHRLHSHNFGRINRSSFGQIGQQVLWLHTECRTPAGSIQIVAQLVKLCVSKHRTQIPDSVQQRVSSWHILYLWHDKII